jgi:hypothetical protein
LGAGGRFKPPRASGGGAADQARNEALGGKCNPGSQNRTQIQIKPKKTQV